ncbi:PKD domain-containing protein [Pontibacter sp. FD36]|uniref:PKD domain-containing protein n=1 Tax=Pontibacter sp. FD36 TaxID=2789860 RepID=UPI0018A89874|nr:PKD domain-containing protein [Pontibacter sp. FD36]MBF8962455.1 PKD domain-containing protein [Pontibacter sp. FD36]
MKNYFLIAVLLFLFSCKEKEDVVLPAIEFELIDKFGHNAEIFAVKEMVRVEAVGEADSYFWEFGDGETSREMKPAHTYKEMGTYTIRLTTKNGDAVRTVRKVIKVGNYYADEVQLINYADSFWVDGTSTDAQSVKETTDMYLSVSKRYYSDEEDPLLFTSEIFKDVDK